MKLSGCVRNVSQESSNANRVFKAVKKYINNSISMTEHIKITACSFSFTYNLICFMADTISNLIDFLMD